MTNLTAMTTAQKTELYAQCARALTNEVIRSIINELIIFIPRTTDTETLANRTGLLAALETELAIRTAALHNAQFTRA